MSDPVKSPEIVKLSCQFATVNPDTGDDIYRQIPVVITVPTSAVVYRSTVTFPVKLPGVSSSAILPSTTGLSAEETSVTKPPASICDVVPTSVNVPLILVSPFSKLTSLIPVISTSSRMFVPDPVTICNVFPEKDTLKPLASRPFKVVVLFKFKLIVNSSPS